MTEPKIIKPDQKTSDDTKAGNYFIANYPPFSFWNDKDIPCVDSLLNSPSPGTAPLGLYYHIPFVESVVTFVTFVSTRIKIPQMYAAILMQPCRSL